MDYCASTEIIFLNTYIHKNIYICIIIFMISPRITVDGKKIGDNQLVRDTCILNLYSSIGWIPCGSSNALKLNGQNNDIFVLQSFY